MAKLAVLAVLLAAVLFVSHTFAYRTLITTVEIDEETNPGRQSQQRCRQEIQRQQQQLQQCGRQLARQIQGRDDLAYDNQQGRETQQCCQALQQIDDQCQCDALQEIMQRQQEQLQGQERQQLERQIQNLPDRCNLGSQAQRCQVSSSRGPY